MLLARGVVGLLGSGRLRGRRDGGRARGSGGPGAVRGGPGGFGGPARGARSGPVIRSRWSAGVVRVPVIAGPAGRGGARWGGRLRCRRPGPRPGGGLVAGGRGVRRAARFPGLRRCSGLRGCSGLRRRSGSRGLFAGVPFPGYPSPRRFPGRCRQRCRVQERGRRGGAGGFRGEERARREGEGQGRRAQGTERAVAAVRPWRGAGRLRGHGVTRLAPSRARRAPRSDALSVTRAVRYGTPAPPVRAALPPGGPGSRGRHGGLAAACETMA